MRVRSRYLIVLVAMIVIAIAARLALPFYVKDYVNSRLAALDAYTGHVDGVHIALWHGAYRIDGLRIVKRDNQKETPFFSSDYVDLSVEWRSLFKGQLVAEGKFQSPNLNLVRADTEQQSELGKEVNWADRLEDLFPFRFNTVEVSDGTVTFRAPGIQTQDALVRVYPAGERRQKLLRTPNSRLHWTNCECRCSARRRCSASCCRRAFGTVSTD